MTDLEATLRSAMGEQADTVGADWAGIERRASRLRRRRRRAERAAFVGSLVAMAGLVAVAVRSGVEPVVPTAGPVPGRMGLDAKVVFVVVALGVAICGGLWLWHRPSGRSVPALSSLADGRARLAAVLTVVSVAVPLWSYASHLRTIDERVEQVAALEGVAVVGIDRHRSPLVGTYQPLATVVVDATGPGGEASLEALAEERWVRVGPRQDGLAAVDLLRGWSPDPVLFAAAVLLATFGVAAAGLLLFDRRRGRLLGRLAVAASAVQCGLVVFALWRAHEALRAYREEAELDSLGVEELSRWDDWSLSEGETLLVERIADVAGALYPLGSLSVIPVLVAWLLGAAAGWRGRARVVVWVVGLVVGLATIAAFPDNDAILWILD